MTPWQYLHNWEYSDRDPKTTLNDVANKMKEHWPGNYRVIVKEFRTENSMYKSSKWVLEFDNTAEETMFRLKWT